MVSRSALKPLRVDFFFDVVSPYSFVAFEILQRYTHASDGKPEGPWSARIRDVRLRPMFLGGVMKETGNQPPAALPARGQHLVRDIERVSTHSEIEPGLSLPEDFPINTLTAMRVLAALENEEGKGEPQRFGGPVARLARAFWVEYWGNGRNISDREVLVRATAAALSYSEAEARSLVEERATAPEAKELLKRTTDEAIERGVYGAPSWFVSVAGEEGQDGDAAEMFFGSDRFEQFAALYGLPWLGPQPIGKENRTGPAKL
jgi:glutathione S-transferase kappa 1